MNQQTAHSIFEKTKKKLAMINNQMHILLQKINVLMMVKKGLHVLMILMNFIIILIC